MRCAERCWKPQRKPQPFQITICQAPLHGKFNFRKHIIKNDTQGSVVCLFCNFSETSTNIKCFPELELYNEDPQICYGFKEGGCFEALILYV